MSKKKVKRNIVCEREELVTSGNNYCKRPIVGSRSSFTFGFKNLHSLQICTPPISPNYDVRRRIEESLLNSKQTRSETKKMVTIFERKRDFIFSRHVKNYGANNF
jgi:hypothetical protein